MTDRKLPANAYGKPIRGDPLFDTEINDIIGTRLANRLDKHPVSRRLVQRKIIRHPLWENIKLDLFKVKFLEEGK